MSMASEWTYIVQAAYNYQCDWNVTITSILWQQILTGQRVKQDKHNDTKEAVTRA